MAEYTKLTVNDGFVRRTEAGVSVTIRATVHMQVSLEVTAKTVSNVYNTLEKEKSQFSEETWEKIEKAHVGGGLNFFYGLFDLSVGGSYNYTNKKTSKDIQQSKEAQKIAQALHDTDTSQVS